MADQHIHATATLSPYPSSFCSPRSVALALSFASRCLSQASSVITIIASFSCTILEARRKSTHTQGISEDIVDFHCLTIFIREFVLVAQYGSMP
jgi:hypothetical protein